MRTLKLSRDEFRIWRENQGDGREILRKALLERNGGHSFRLMSPMARFIGTVRGENSVVSAAPMGVQNNAPSPDTCVCKAYAGTEPGKHHPVCQFRNAWENSRGINMQTVPNLNPAMAVVSQRVAAPLDTTPRVQHMMVPKEVPAHAAHMKTTQAAVASQHAPMINSAPQVVVQVPAIVALIPPEQCDCRQFTKPSGHDPKQHHVICAHFDKWRTAHPTVQSTNEVPDLDTSDTEPPQAIDFVLADLDTQEVLRTATSEEVELARVQEEKTGSPLIRIEDKIYGVVERPKSTASVAP